MNPKSFLVVVLFACVMLFATREAQAFYNPSTGRWLSRDPVEERGNELTSNINHNSEPQQNKVNLYLIVLNDVIDKTDRLGLNPNIAPGTTFTVDIEGGGKSTVTVDSHFSEEEKKTALRALCMVRKLLGEAPYAPPFSDVYWAEISSKGGNSPDGLTYKGSIFLDKHQKPNCDPGATARFGALLAHEADHFYTKSDDGPGGPEDRINKPVFNALLRASGEPWCGCCKGLWQLENLLGKYACECGLIKPCKAKPCPKPESK